MKEEGEEGGGGEEEQKGETFNCFKSNCNCFT